MKKIRLGIIGCGIAAKELHLPAIKKHKDKFEIVAACNRTEKKAKEYSRLTGGIPYTTDCKEIMKNPDVDAVVIAVPIELNYKFAAEAIKSGKHVFLEKPLAAKPGEAGKLIAMQKRTKAVCFLAENFRFDPLYLETKKLLNKKIIGDVYSVVWNVFNNLTLKDKYAQTKWRQKNKYPGGFVYDGGVHNAAALRMLFGDIKSGYASMKSVNPAIGTEDTFSFLFNFDKSMHGILNIFFSVRGFHSNEMIIFGNKGSLILQNNGRIIIKRDGRKDQKIKVKTDGGYENEFLHFYKIVTRKVKNLSPFEEGFKDMMTLQKAFESAKKNKLIKLF
ncbi:Gfo/Idh/MocA family protein [Melioribacter sp. Ez-97]|jgi:predicted dehydrogenase|uniref:Gfo/Idh/MocA family protein n=1 Tax=Melioribacter sp. Ez-97 TaxID=3423434 RepID=UPI003EDA2B9B